MALTNYHVEASPETAVPSARGPLSLAIHFAIPSSIDDSGVLGEPSPTAPVSVSFFAPSCVSVGESMLALQNVSE